MWCTPGREVVWHSFKSMSLDLCSTFIQMDQRKSDFSVSKNYIQKENHLLINVRDPNGVSSENIQQNSSFCVCVCVCGQELNFLKFLWRVSKSDSLVGRIAKSFNFTSYIFNWQAVWFLLVSNRNDRVSERQQISLWIPLLSDCNVCMAKCTEEINPWKRERSVFVRARQVTTSGHGISLDSGDGCTMLWIHYKVLNCIHILKFLIGG